MRTHWDPGMNMAAKAEARLRRIYPVQEKPLWRQPSSLKLSS